MTRFDLDMDGYMEPSEHGLWVRHEDVEPFCQPLTFDDIKQIRHCMIAVRDWMAEGFDTNDIPRTQIAELVAYTDYRPKGEA